MREKYVLRCSNTFIRIYLTAMFPFDKQTLTKKIKFKNLFVTIACESVQFIWALQCYDQLGLWEHVTQCEFLVYLEKLSEGLRNN